jgi:hypothetical protein
MLTLIDFDDMLRQVKAKMNNDDDIFKPSKSESLHDVSDDYDEFIEFIQFLMDFDDEESDICLCDCCDNPFPYEVKPHSILSAALDREDEGPLEVFRNPEGARSLLIVVVATVMALEGLTQALLANGTITMDELRGAQDAIKELIDSLID